MATMDRDAKGVVSDEGLGFDIDEQPPLSLWAQQLLERTDRPATAKPELEIASLPLVDRVRMFWHRHHVPHAPRR